MRQAKTGRSAAWSGRTAATRTWALPPTVLITLVRSHAVGDRSSTKAVPASTSRRSSSTRCVIGQSSSGAVSPAVPSNKMSIGRRVGSANRAALATSIRVTQRSAGAGPAAGRTARSARRAASSSGSLCHVIRSSAPSARTTATRPTPASESWSMVRTSAARSAASCRAVRVPTKRTTVRSASSAGQVIRISMVTVNASPSSTASFGDRTPPDDPHGGRPDTPIPGIDHGVAVGVGWLGTVGDGRTWRAGRAVARSGDGASTASTASAVAMSVPARIAEDRVVAIVHLQGATMGNSRGASVRVRRSIGAASR